MHLAKASERRHPGEAVRAYSEHVERLVNGSGHPRYEEAAVLIEHMATLRDAAEQARYVADLKSRFARKRNFMKLLR